MYVCMYVCMYLIFYLGYTCMYIVCAKENVLVKYICMHVRICVHTVFDKTIKIFLLLTVWEPIAI